MSSTKLPQKEAINIFGTLKKVGLTPITSIVPISGSKIKNSYDINTDKATAVLILENKKVFYCYSGDVVLYNLSDGGIKANINDYILSSTEKIYFISYAQNYVKNGLKAPSTAKFPSFFLSLDDYRVTRYKGTVTVSSYVDSQNSFGAMLRSNFVVKIGYKTHDCEYLEIAGTVLCK